MDMAGQPHLTPIEDIGARVTDAFLTPLPEAYSSD